QSSEQFLQVEGRFSLAQACIVCRVQGKIVVRELSPRVVRTACQVRSQRPGNWYLLLPAICIGRRSGRSASAKKEKCGVAENDFCLLLRIGRDRAEQFLIERVP